MDNSNNNYFDHDADIGIIGRGKTLEKAFESAAQATFAIMTNLEKVKLSTCIDIEFEETDPELALLTWLNSLIGEARANAMIFSRFQLKYHHGRWKGKAWGQAWQADTERGVEVKGATLTMLSVNKNHNQWEARCVVDV